MKVILYSTHCPKCTVLEKKLNQKNIQYDIVTDIDLMQEKGFLSLPVLDVDGDIMDFGDAIKWVNGEWLTDEYRIKVD